MNKGVLILIFVLLIVSNLFIYKLSLDKKDISEEKSQITLDKITNLYHWFFWSIVVIIVLVVLFAILQRNV